MAKSKYEIKLERLAKLEAELKAERDKLANSIGHYFLKKYPDVTKLKDARYIIDGLVADAENEVVENETKEVEKQEPVLKPKSIEFNATNFQ